MFLHFDENLNRQRRNGLFCQDWYQGLYLLTILKKKGHISSTINRNKYERDGSCSTKVTVRNNQKHTNMNASIETEVDSDELWPQKMQWYAKKMQWGVYEVRKEMQWKVMAVMAVVHGCRNMVKSGVCAVVVVDCGRMLNHSGCGGGCWSRVRSTDSVVVQWF